FGNTRLKCAVFENDVIKTTVILKDDPVADLQNLIKEYKPQKSILSSVVDHPVEIEKILDSQTIFHKLTYESKIPFTIPVGKPETVGADRLAIASASVFLFPSKNNLAIGLGSCITFNFINQFNELLGGSISPGMEMRFKAMH